MIYVPVTSNLLQERETEVKRYLDFLEAALERGAAITTSQDIVPIPLSLELTHTLKANTLLLLYSVMEATLVQLLDEMYDLIGKRCASADALNATLVELVMETFKSSKHQARDLRAPLHHSLFDAWVSDWQSRTKAKDKRTGGISGSVDGLVFYKQLKRFGVVCTADDKAPAHLTHIALQRIKDGRNTLAHGENSFADKGRELEITALREDARHVFATLNSIATEVSTYLAEQRYLANPPMVLASADGTEA